MGDAGNTNGVIGNRSVERRAAAARCLVDFNHVSLDAGAALRGVHVKTVAGNVEGHVAETGDVDTQPAARDNSRMIVRHRIVLELDVRSCPELGGGDEDAAACGG